MPSRVAAFILLAAACHAQAAFASSCRVQSSASRTPVVELYTSEGCSSCPPADRWLSGLKEAAAAGRVVVQGFHVSYWDSLGWIDRFASPAYNARQRDIAARAGARNVYTPQLVRDGRDTRDYGTVPAGSEPAGAVIRLERQDGQAVAEVTPRLPGARWAAYWTVTEHGHASKVRSGENAGEFLQHDFVVRQFEPAGTHEGTHRLTLRPVPAEPGHPQQVNLVVFDPATGMPLQGASVQCAG